MSARFVSTQQPSDSQQISAASCISLPRLQHTLSDRYHAENLAASLNKTIREFWSLFILGPACVIDQRPALSVHHDGGAEVCWAV